MFQSDSVAFAASGDGIFITPAGLSGFLSAEMATTQPLAARLGKFYYAFFKQLANFRDANADVVGVNVSRADEVVEDRYGVRVKNFTLTFQQVVDSRTNTLFFPTVAVTGIRAGLADFALTDIFPTAVKVASGAMTSGGGVLILSSAITAENASLTHAAIDLSADCRRLVRAILGACFTFRPLRTAETASSLVTASISSASASTIPTTWTQALNPFTALIADDARYQSVVQRTFSFGIETIEDENAQTFDVNTIVTPIA